MKRSSARWSTGHRRAALVCASLVALLLPVACGGVPQEELEEEDLSGGTWAVGGTEKRAERPALDRPGPRSRDELLTPPEPDDDPVPVILPASHLKSPTSPQEGPGLKNLSKTVTLDDPVPIQPIVVQTKR